VLQATTSIYFASRLMTTCPCIFIQGKTKERNARLAMSLWYLEDNQHQNTIKYASSVSIAKKNIIMEMKRKITSLIS
jgi:hypothetical protein